MVIGLDTSHSSLLPPSFLRSQVQVPFISDESDGPQSDVTGKYQSCKNQSGIRDYQIISINGNHGNFRRIWTSFQGPQA